ncbi:hypothetical protein NSK11_contig00026-0013 [Nocardia seriolae]|uniref:DUF3291 domain-containing protein n=1 Tax=Nocardia seriolae TaxID=37332 RepID=A0ABC9YRE7_9NOCA|nr:hypothetical protein NSK11_contig00026-0013 [Nocardia seriolae]
MTSYSRFMHLAQLNIGRLVAAEGDPRVADFYAALDEINALAETSPASSGAWWTVTPTTPPACAPTGTIRTCS